METAIATALFGVVFVGFLCAVTWYGRRWDRLHGIRNDEDYVKYLARQREAEPEREKRAPRQRYSQIIRALFQRYSPAIRPLFQRAIPRNSPPVVRLGLFDDHDTPADVLPEFERADDLIRWLATHTVMSQGQVQRWFRGEGTRLAYLVKDERDKYKAKYGVDLWSADARRERKEREAMDDESGTGEVQMRLP
jgi:hypothetical protein